MGVDELREAWKDGRRLSITHVKLCPSPTAAAATSAATCILSKYAACVLSLHTDEPLVDADAAESRSPGLRRPGFDSSITWN